MLLIMFLETWLTAQVSQISTISIMSTTVVRDNNIMHTYVNLYEN